MTKQNDESKVAIIKAEINKQLGDAETLKSLLEVTFPGFEAPLMKRALLEGMMRGFPFESFLKKDVYAIKYASTYSLVTSIEYSRKIGAKSGIVGVDAPMFTYENNQLVRCSITVKKRFPDGYVGDFTAEPSLKEYSTGKNLWISKPETMLSKVAEMHALRKACPEELAQSYVEEELMREVVAVPSLDLLQYEKDLLGCKTLEQLERVWADMPGDAKRAASILKMRDDIKAMINDVNALEAEEAKSAERVID